MANAPTPPLLSYQPLRFLFQLLYLISIISRLPYYFAVSLIHPLRPNPRWSFRQTFMTRFAQPMLDLVARVGITETLTLQKGKEGDRFVVVKPSAASLYKGVLISDPTVQPAVIGGTWFPTVPGVDATSKTIVLYFHGGAFVEGNGRDATCRSIAEKMLTKGGADAVFSFQYRLSGYGGRDPFPAALQDALSSYLYLLHELQIPAQQVVFVGDSAGGNLATALLLYLTEHGSAINVLNPRCVALVSSWVAPFDYNIEDSPQSQMDFIPQSYPIWGANCYAGHLLPGAKINPYITPLGNTFSTSTPILVHAGTAEITFSYIMKWAEDMRHISGNQIQVYLEEDAVHDTLLSGGFLGFEESAWEVVAAIGKFVKTHASV